MLTAIDTHAAPTRRSIEAKLERRLDAYVSNSVAEGHLSGRLILRQGDLSLDREWGMADFDAKRPFHDGESFLVASISKPMTVALVGRLIDDGRLRLSDPVSNWIADWPFGEGMTVQHLIDHRAGIPHRLAEEDDRTQQRDARSMTERAKARSLLFQPGDGVRYSNGGYSVLARVLDLAGEASFGSLLQERIFGPAGMEDSRATGLPQGATIRSHVPDRNGPRKMSAEWNPTHLTGAASVATTAEDLLRFRQAVSRGTLGPTARRLLDRERIDWGGNVHGWRAWQYHDRKAALDIVFTGNLHSGAVDRLSRDLPRLIAGAKVRPLPKLKLRPVERTESELMRFTGRFRIPTGAAIPFYVDAGALWADGWILIPLGKGRFFSPQDYVVLQAVGRGEERIVRWDWIEGGRTVACPRVDP